MIKRYIIMLFSGILSACLLLAFSPSKMVQISSFKPSKIVSELVEEQEKAHDQCLARIKADFNVPEQTWDTYMKAIKDTIESDDLMGVSANKAVGSNEPWIIQKTREILCEYGINPDRVSINQVSGEGDRAQAIQDIDENKKVVHSIEINVDWFAQHSKEMQEAFIRHEIMHLINYDPVRAGYILFMLESLGNNLKECETHPAIIAYNQQRELRADLLASCDNKAIAQALCEHYTHYANNLEEIGQKWFTHPPHAVRAEKMAHLVNAMGNQSQIIA